MVKHHQMDENNALNSKHRTGQYQLPENGAKDEKIEIFAVMTVMLSLRYVL